MSTLRIGTVSVPVVDAVLTDDEARKILIERGYKLDDPTQTVQLLVSLAPTKAKPSTRGPEIVSTVQKVPRGDTGTGDTILGTEIGVQQKQPSRRAANTGGLKTAKNVSGLRKLGAV